MIPSTARAARKLNPEPGSWSKDSIEHRAYRQMPLLPEEETHRHRRSRKNRERHVHKWTKWELQRSETYRSWWFRKKIVRIDHYEASCKKCGLKRQRRNHL